MNKPTSLSYKEYKETIVNATNNSGLPAFLLAEALSDIYRQVLQQKEIELKQDEALWHKACSEVNDDGGNK